jgi:hypothetical protein
MTTSTIASRELNDDTFAQLDAIIEGTKESNEVDDSTFEKLDAIIGDEVLNPFKVGSFIFAQFTPTSSIQAFTVKTETEKAVLLECNYTQVWFPKSAFQIELTKNEHGTNETDATVKYWFRSKSAFIWN